MFSQKAFHFKRDFNILKTALFKTKLNIVVSTSSKTKFDVFF